MRHIAFALALAALAGAQTPVVSIGPNTAAMSGKAVGMAGTVRTGVPILGYVVGPGSLDLRTILGTGKAAQLGDSVAVPAGSKRLFVPPREHYLLLEGATGPLAVWLPAKAVMGDKPEGAAMDGALAHPDLVVFSPRGEAAVLYAKSADELQVVHGLPGQPVVAARPGIGKFGEAANFAVADDGAAVVAQLTDGSAIISLHGGGWQRSPAAYGARALAFIPKTHSLVVSDAGQQTLAVVEVGDQPQSARILAQGIVADRLAFTKEGDQLLAASSSQAKLWTVDLRTATADAGWSTAVDMLLPLRDGRTFLLSTAPGLSLLSVPAGGESAVGFVPLTR